MDKFISFLRYLPVVETIPYFVFYYVASVIRMLKTKSSKDVSLIAWATSTFVHYMYVLYGILIVKEWQYVVACIFASLGSSLVLLTAIYYRIKTKKEKPLL